MKVCKFSFASALFSFFVTVFSVSSQASEPRYDLGDVVKSCALTWPGFDNQNHRSMFFKNGRLFDNLMKVLYTDDKDIALMDLPFSESFNALVRHVLTGGEPDELAFAEHLKDGQSITDHVILPFSKWLLSDDHLQKIRGGLKAGIGDGYREKIKLSEHGRLKDQVIFYGTMESFVFFVITQVSTSSKTDPKFFRDAFYRLDAKVRDFLKLTADFVYWGKFFEGYSLGFKHTELDFWQKQTSYFCCIGGVPFFYQKKEWRLPDGISKILNSLSVDGYGSRRYISIGTIEMVRSFLIAEEKIKKYNLSQVEKTKIRHHRLYLEMSQEFRRDVAEER